MNTDRAYIEPLCLLLFFWEVLMLLLASLIGKQIVNFWHTQVTC